MVDQFSGQGGSYVANADGSRSLVFRTGVGAVEAEPNRPKTKRKGSQTQPTQEELSDGQMA